MVFENIQSGVILEQHPITRGLNRNVCEEEDRGIACLVSELESSINGNLQMHHVTESSTTLKCILLYKYRLEENLWDLSKEKRC